MAHEIVYTTGKLSDRQIVQLVKKIDEKFGHGSLNYIAGSLAIPAEEIDSLVAKRNSKLITEASITTSHKSFQVYYRRGTSGLTRENALNINERIPSPYYDELIVTLGQTDERHNTKSPSTEDLRDFDSIVQKSLTVVVPNSDQTGTSGSIEILQAEVAALAELHRRMVDEAIERAAEHDKRFNERLAELDARSDADYAAIESAKKKANQEIDKVRAELEQAQKDLDDRDHMHVRRELREKISEDIKVRVSQSLVPEKAASLGSLITTMTWVCTAALACVSAFFFYTLANAFAQNSDVQIPLTTQLWLIGRTVLASAGTVGFALYALGWMRKTYLDDVRVTNDLQRYALDINRASWTIETIMEMTTKEGRVLPDQWIAGVCHGLFRSADHEKAEVTPLEAWGALLGVSGQVEYGTDGPKIKINQRQARKMAKDTAND